MATIDRTIGSNSANLVTYTYDGDRMTSRSVRTEYADRVRMAGAAEVRIDYMPAYDDHGRITTISNVARAGVHSQNLAAFGYTYDHAGNRLTHVGSVPTPSNPVGHAKAREVGYTYDGLHRVVRADYAQPAAVSTAFNYDLLGNRKTVDDGLNGVYRKYYGEQGALGANNVNEYLDVSVGPDAGSQVSQGFLYDEDRRGNLVRDDGFDDNPNDAFLYSYDPENRLTKVEYDDDASDQTGPVTMAEYRYDALGRRIEYKRYNTGGALVETIRYYHDGQNVIAEYIVDGGGAENQARSFVNGSQYIDERIVMRDHVSRQDHYYLHQELYSAAGLASANGALEEAYVYDTYGDAHIWQWRKGDFNRDGDVNNDDVTMFGDAPWFDLDFDGDTDSADQALMETGNNPTKLAYSAVNNPYLFTGRLTDTLHSDSPTDVAHIRRLQDNRERIYDPKHGRWLQRDSLGIQGDDGYVNVEDQYSDGPNVYLYCRGNPSSYFDPTGQLSLQGAIDAAMSACIKLPGQKSFYFGVPIGPLGEIGGELTVQKSPGDCCCCDFLVKGQGALNVTGKIRVLMDKVIPNWTSLRRSVKRYMPTAEAYVQVGGGGKVCKQSNGTYSGDFCKIAGAIGGEFGLKEADGRTNRASWVCAGPVCARMLGSIQGQITLDICGQKDGSSLNLGATGSLGFKWRERVLWEGSMSGDLLGLSPWDGWSILTPSEPKCD